VSYPDRHPILIHAYDIRSRWGLCFFSFLKPIFVHAAINIPNSPSAARSVAGGD